MLLKSQLMSFDKPHDYHHYRAFIKRVVDHPSSSHQPVIHLAVIAASRVPPSCACSFKGDIVLAVFAAHNGTQLHQSDFGSDEPVTTGKRIKMAPKNKPKRHAQALSP